MRTRSASDGTAGESARKSSPRLVGARNRRRTPFEQRDGVVGGHGKVQPLPPAVTHRRDADGHARAIEQRAAAVAWVDGGIGLYQRRAAALPQRADDTARHGVLKRAERGSDRDHVLAYPCVCRRSQADDGLPGFRARDLQHGDVEFRRRRRDARGRRGAAHAADGDGTVAADDMHVRDQGVGGHEESAAAAARCLDEDHRRHDAAHDVLERRGGLAAPAAAAKR